MRERHPELVVLVTWTLVAFGLAATAMAGLMSLLCGMVGADCERGRLVLAFAGSAVALAGGVAAAWRGAPPWMGWTLLVAAIAVPLAAIDVSV